MSWQLQQWKRCDGGCAVRAPRFPVDEVDQYRSGDRHATTEPGGTNPDGGEWEGGNALHAELWALYESHGRDATLITTAELRALPGLDAILALNWPLQGLWAGQPLQWFLDTDWGWPVRGPHARAVLDRFAALGLWDPALYDPGLDYTTIHPERDGITVETPFDGPQISVLGQHFHTRHDQTDAERQALADPCCHLWRHVDGRGDPI